MKMKAIKRKVKRKIHSFELPKNLVDQKVLDVLHFYETPVTTREFEKDDELLYEIKVLAADEEWDSINRKLGALGIDK